MYRKIDVFKIEEFYEIFSDGKILRKSSNLFLAFRKNSYGYYQVYLKEFKTSFLVHRIVLTKFNDVINSYKLQVNHKNKNRLDNTLDNLEWCTCKENISHSNIGREYSHNNLDIIGNDMVLKIYKDLLNGMTTTECIKKYNVCKSTILNIKYKRTHKNILSEMDDITKYDNSGKITEQIKNEVLRMSEEGIKPCKIATELNLKRQTVLDIRSNYIISCKDFQETFKGGEKLTKEQVIEIIYKYNKGMTIIELSDIYKVHKTSIVNILKRKTWKGLTKDTFINNL